MLTYFTVSNLMNSQNIEKKAKLVEKYCFHLNLIVKITML